MDQMNPHPVRIIERHGRPTLSLSGSVDIFVAKELYEAACALLDREEDIAVQWAVVEAVDVSALQILLALQAGLRAKGRRLQFDECSPTIRRFLAVGGLTTGFSEAAR